ncbi:MAG TPA: NAD(P)-dependent oxidoreductase [Stellaceae bacterium]|nr:NAD(P)-dependent oxidoreductase [Stellaceae bacterium]
MQIGFCGLGRMGAAMVARLLDQGQKPVVWNRNPDKIKPSVTKGARAAPTPAAVAAQSDIVLSILLDEPAVRAVYDGQDGLLSGDVKGKLFVDMSTVAPTVPQDIAAHARAKGAGFLECPVGGTVGPAREGRLIGMVGGDAADFARAKPVLELLCRKVDHLGPNGAGAAMKLAINLPLCIYWEALGEAIALTRDFKIPPAKMMEIFAESSGGINGLKVRGPAVVKTLETGERPPVGFTIDGVIKDMNIMLDWARHLGIELPALERVRTSYQAASRAGWDQADNCSVLFYRLAEAQKAAR